MKKYLVTGALLLALAGSALLSSCGTTKEVVYFQDLKPGETEIRLPEVQTITVQPEDKISIIVNSRDPQLTNLFNLPYLTRQIGQTSLNNELSISNNSQESPATR